MPSSSSTQEEEVVVVIVHLDFHIGSTLLTNFYKIISKFNSNIIVNKSLLNDIIYHTKHNTSQLSIPTPPQLLYRGSRDGFKGIDFHSKCDNQGPTLTIIKSTSTTAAKYKKPTTITTNHIFGGFTTQNWEPESLLYGEWKSDSSAFIFKIVNEKKQLLSFRKFNIKQAYCDNAIYVHMDCLPKFGTDICICSDCNLNNDSYSHFGTIYEIPSTRAYKFKSGSDKANNYLAGSHEFKVNEIEVFKIITTTIN